MLLYFPKYHTRIVKRLVVHYAAFLTPMDIRSNSDIERN